MKLNSNFQSKGGRIFITSPLYTLERYGSMGLGLGQIKIS